jgi:low temperature requirement protein LtrA
MCARPVDEPHRVSSQLELLFDLTFVVAVAAATTELAQAVIDGHAGTGVIAFLEVFFAIWWAWMNFTWFASSYDTDDITYRLMTLVQMGGVLVLAAGVPAAADHSDYLFVAVGYLVMRSGLVAQWLRAALEYPGGRRTALRYAGGVGLLQVGWVIWLVLGKTGTSPTWAQLPLFVGLASLELAVPRWAERTGATTWHPHHIAERYGLFTIVLLGESVLAASTGVQSAIATANVGAELIGVAVASLVMLFALWWLYFLQPAGPGLAENRDRSYWWGYGHYGLFAALAALGAGLKVAVEQTAHPSSVSPVVATYAVALPAATFTILLWIVHRSIVADPVISPTTTGPAAVAIGIIPLGAGHTGVPVALGLVAVVEVLVVVASLCSQRREQFTLRRLR